jgi:hypothetical protein
MMPGGCVLLDVPGLSLALTNKLGIDAAKAVVRFTFKRGFAYPAYASGLVVAEENVEILRMACEEQFALQKERSLDRSTKRIMANWRKLVRRALIFAKLEQRFEK